MCQRKEEKKRQSRVPTRVVLAGKSRWDRFPNNVPPCVFLLSHPLRRILIKSLGERRWGRTKFDKEIDPDSLTLYLHFFSTLSLLSTLSSRLKSSSPTETEKERDFSRTSLRSRLIIQRFANNAVEIVIGKSDGPKRVRACAPLKAKECIVKKIYMCSSRREKEGERERE